MLNLWFLEIILIEEYNGVGFVPVFILNRNDIFERSSSSWDYKSFEKISIWNPPGGDLTFSFWFEYKTNEIEFEIINSLNSKLKQKKLKNEDWVCIEILLFWVKGGQIRPKITKIIVLSPVHDYFTLFKLLIRLLTQI